MRLSRLNDVMLRAWLTGGMRALRLRICQTFANARRMLATRV
jgi:hypothetical protein